MSNLISDTGRIIGTRSTIYEIVHYLEGGWQPQEIADLLRLPLETIQAAIQYIEEHKEAVLEVHRQIEERIAQGNPPEIVAKLQQTRARMQERLRASRARSPEANGAGDPRRP